VIGGAIVSPRNDDVSVEGEGAAEEMVALPVTLRRSLLEPTAVEREVHNSTHMPYRAWCEFCVRGKAESAPHRRHSGDKLHENPVVSIDYMYMKASEAETPAEREKEESGHLRGNPIDYKRFCNSLDFSKRRACEG